MAQNTTNNTSALIRSIFNAENPYQQLFDLVRNNNGVKSDEVKRLKPLLDQLSDDSKIKTALGITAESPNTSA